eukprot:1654880-Amphidinium_carterae.1
MPSQAANIISSNIVNLNKKISAVPRVLEARVELGLKRPLAPARCPKGRPCTKTLSMASDCHKTWHTGKRVVEKPPHRGTQM